MAVVGSTTADEWVKYIILSLHEVHHSLPLLGDERVVRVDPLARELEVFGDEGITISLRFL